MLRNKWGLLFFNLVASVLFSFLFSSGEVILTYINVLFYITAFYMTSVLIMIVLKGGFLNATVYSMRKVFSRNRKHRDYFDDREENPLPSEKINSALIITFSWQAIFLGIIMGVFLFIYYA